MANEKAIVLMSGGLNSAVTAALAAADFNIAALHVHYGHRAEQYEAELFGKQADRLEIRERLVVSMPSFAAIGGNARVSRKRQIEDAAAIQGSESSCYVPGLIGALAQVGFTWAWNIGATRIFIGVSENLGPPGPRTSSVYPDYSREYLQLCNHLFSVASPAKAVTLEAPLVDLSRTEIIQLGRRLEVPFELTWSCLSSGTECCGACLGCATRNRGFLDAAIPDPILLQTAAR